METALHHHYHRPIIPHTSSASPVVNHRSSQSKNVRTHLVLAMRGNLTLQRISANSLIVNKFQDPARLFCHTTQKAMTDQASKSTENIKKQEEEEEEESSEKLPPPPEKPLPGDCCGSGCVRCVWDLYYEELEDYNKLYKCDSKSKSKPS